MNLKDDQDAAMTVAVRLARLVALLASISALAGCASSWPPEAPAVTPAAAKRPSAANPADLQQVDAIREVIDGQSRALDAEQVEAEPDCSRIRLLARNICTLAEHICTIAARYPADDPIRDACTDARARCRRADETVKARCLLAPE